MAILGQNFQNSSVKVQYYRTPIDVFFPEFHADLPVTKKCEFIVPVTKNDAFSPPFCSPLAQRAIILTREI